MILEKENFIDRTEKFLLEYVEYIPNHKNSKGEDSPWVIKSHMNDRIISSHKTKKDAKNHLQQIRMFKHIKGVQK